MYGKVDDERFPEGPDCLRREAVGSSRTFERGHDEIGKFEKEKLNVK